MKIQSLYIACLLIIVLAESRAQVTGTPQLFPVEELTIASFYKVSEIGDDKYLFNVIPLLNGAFYPDSVIWSTSDPSLAIVDGSGVAKIVNFADTTIAITVTSFDRPDLVGTMAIDISEAAFFEILDGIEIIVNPSITERGAQPIGAFTLPKRRRDMDATFTVSDPEIVRIENDSIIPLKDGEVTINVVSSGSDTIVSSRTIVVADVTDMTPPIFCIEYYDGGDSVFVQRDTSLTLPQAIAKDEVDGNLGVTITELGNTFDGSMLGTYPVRYFAEDAAGNADTIDIDFIIIDSLPPTLTFDIDTIEIGQTFESIQGEGFVLPTVTAIDENGDILPVNVDNDGFHPDTIGTYHIVYTAIDPSGNIGETRIDVVVNMGFPPTISLSDGYEDGDTICIDQNDTLHFPIASAVDELGNVVVVNVEKNGIDISVAGISTIEYIAEDRFGTMDSVVLYVKINDITPPIISNKTDIKNLLIEYDSVASPTLLTQVLASDNIGVTHFTIEEVGLSPFEFLTQTGGSIQIDASGNITIMRGSFEANFIFLIKAFDTVGNFDSTYMEVAIINFQPPDIEVKESAIAEWNQIGWNMIGQYSKTIQDNFPLGSEILYLHALRRSFTTLDSLAISGAGSEDFELVDYNPDPGTSILQLKNPLDINTQAFYTIQVDIYGYLNPGDASSVVGTFWLNIDLQSVQQLSPVSAEIDSLLDPGMDLTLRNLFSIYSNKGLPSPNQSVLGGELYQVFDEDLLQLPIVQSGLGLVDAKAIIKFLPYAVWFTKESSSSSGTLYRIFLKFEKGPASYQMEFVMDRNRQYAYYTISVGSSKTGAGIQASTIHPSLAFLDHPRANLVLTSTTVDKSNFKCIEVVSELDFGAGVHFVARGNILPSAPSGLINPVASFRIGFTGNTWDDPGVIVNLDLDPEFLAAFDNVMVDYLLDASNIPKIAIEQAIDVVNIAQANVYQAEYVFNQASAVLASIKRNIARPQAALDEIDNRLDEINGEISFALNTIADLKSQELCIPGCWIPIYEPAWCTSDYIPTGYPCAKFVGCEPPEVCLPDPAALAQLPFWYVQYAALNSIKASILGFRPITAGILEAAKLPLIPAEIALDEARISVEALRLILIAAEQSLETTIDGFGAVGDMAKFLIDKSSSLIESSNASLQTNIGAANSGSFTGDLGFSLKFKGASPIGFNVGFGFNDPEAIAEGVAQSLID